MRVTEPDSRRPASRLHVVVGVLRRRDLVLMQRRMPGKPCAGQWEFPGGKVEPGEAARDALARELKEELGIKTLRAQPLVNLPFDYPHARVWLEVFLIHAFSGEAAAQEGQRLRWLAVATIPRLNLLGAVIPILAALRHAPASRR